MHAQTLPAMLMDQAARQGARAWVQAPGGTLEYGEAPAHAALGRCWPPMACAGATAWR